MKKSILVSAAVLLTITAFAFVKLNSSNPDKKNTTAKVKKDRPEASLPFYFPKPANLYYDIGSRFMPITKTAIAEATSVRDFFTDYDHKHITSVQGTNLILIENDEHTSTQFKGKGEKLSPEQKEYLRACNYSTNLKLSIRCQATDKYNKREEWAKYTPHFSIVPEQQARYSEGKHAFVEYLKEGNLKNAYGLESDKVGFAKLTFTVNADGSISKEHLDRSCGYKKIDEAMFKLLKNAPGKWIPAINAEGNHVAQELVISFGKAGC